MKDLEENNVLSITPAKIHIVDKDDPTTPRESLFVKKNHDMGG